MTRGALLVSQAPCRRRLRRGSLGLPSGPGPCPGTFAAPRRPLPGQAVGRQGERPPATGAWKATQAQGAMARLPGDGSRVSSPGARSAKSGPQGLETAPGPRQARADGSGSGLWRSGTSRGGRGHCGRRPDRSSTPSRPLRAPPREEAGASASCSPVSQPHPSPATAGSRKPTGCARLAGAGTHMAPSPGLGRRPRPSLPDPSSRISETNGRLKPRGSH